MEIQPFIDLINPAAMFNRFARFYDDDYRFYSDDTDAIMELAEAQGGNVLELGCGTGRLLCPLVEAGFKITGVDISPVLLDVARDKLALLDDPDLATFVEDDMRTFDLPDKDFAFAFCTTNTLMHMTTPEDQLAVLRNANAHLRSGGLLFIDLFSPDVAHLNDVNGVMELADQRIDNETGARVIKWSVRTIDWATQLQETLFIYEEIFDDGRCQRTACPFPIRFLWRNEGQLMLEKAGFVVEEVWGDFFGSDYQGDSEHLIYLARKP